MNTHNIHFYDQIIKFLYTRPNICFELTEEFPRDSKTSSNQP